MFFSTKYFDHASPIKKHLLIGLWTEVWDNLDWIPLTLKHNIRQPIASLEQYNIIC